MKLTVKTLKGSHFDIRVQPSDTIRYLESLFLLWPMLQELGKQNPQLLRLIPEHHAEFLQLINEPVEGIEGDLFDQPEQGMPHTISLSPAEQEAIAQIEAMGFDRAHAIEAFLACDRNEELAVTYLLEDADDEE